MTWTLVALGIVIVAIGGVLFATAPWHAGWPPAMWPPARGPQAGAPQAGAPQAATPQPGAPQVGGPPAGGPQAAAPQTGVPPTGYPGYWYGYPYGYPHAWGFWRGPRFFGGGLLILVLVILVVSLFVRRGRYWGYHRRDDPQTPEEILRRAFAEGSITEEEYQRRMSALRR